MTTPRRTADIAKEVDGIPINHMQDTTPQPKVVGDTWIREVPAPYNEDGTSQLQPVKENTQMGVLHPANYPNETALSPGRLTLSRNARMKHRSF